MPDLPFLFFPQPTVVTRRKLGGMGGTYRKPTPAQQRARLQTKFDLIAQSFQDLQTTVAGIDPEQAIVLETLTSAVQDVAKAAARIPGLEWLAERDLDDVDPEFGFADEQSPDEAVPRRLYALMSNQQAMDQLIALWSEWTQNPNQRAKHGFGPFKQLFALMRDIRRWGPQDRIAETGVLDCWREAVAIGAMTTFEVEFWFRTDPTKRQQAYGEVERLVQGLGGSMPRPRHHPRNYLPRRPRRNARTGCAAVPRRYPDWKLPASPPQPGRHVLSRESPIGFRPAPC